MEYNQLTQAEIDCLRKIALRHFMEEEINCGLTMTRCLSEFFQLPVHQQVYDAVNGIMEHRAKRVQCGLYKGAMAFLGIYCTARNYDRNQLNAATLAFAEAFEQKFGSIRCYDLRPEGFEPDNTHAPCRELVPEAVVFAAAYIKTLA